MQFTHEGQICTLILRLWRHISRFEVCFNINWHIMWPILYQYLTLSCINVFHKGQIIWGVPDSTREVVRDYIKNMPSNYNSFLIISRCDALFKVLFINISLIGLTIHLILIFRDCSIHKCPILKLDWALHQCCTPLHTRLYTQVIH